MKKTIARVAGTLSIALLAAVVTPISASAADIVSAADFVPKSSDLSAKNVKASREYRAAFSKDAQDRKGYEKSLYRGKYYHADQENWRKCVMKRESHHTYTSRNGSSSAAGAYQFLDNSWRDGLVFMMLKESKKHNHGLEKKLKTHFDKPIQQWNRYFQDRAFFTALNYNGKWSGKHHWNATVPGTSC